MKAYIVGGYRSAIGKAPKGSLRFTRPDDIGAVIIRHLLNDFPQIETAEVDDVIVGNAFPEAETGFNMGRLLSLMSFDNVEVPGSTVNRYCASGLETIAIASAKITAGISDIIVAGGAETMSMINMGGWRMVPNPDMAIKHPKWFLSMGLTSEMVAEEYKVTRKDQDKFALESVKKAIHAIDSGKFKEEIVPINVKENYFEDGKNKTRDLVFDTDEGPRRGTTLEGLSKLKPAFSSNGFSTAGNSSQMSDGAAFVLVVSEKILKRYNLEPMARLVDYQVAGVDPYKMGIGPIKAIPKVLKHSGLNLKDIDLIELNEAFASQSLAVIDELGLNKDLVNVNGGAIALGHPLGATGAKLSVQLLHELKRRKGKYGMVTMCIGTGQGAAGIFEML
ncbi:MAG: acetyl-CoA C-acyltransferase [Lentimicrobiaceae bacterium]|jgi:acetyl-CoA acyltransferase|nr:acetyl-CoA C-acyltransferase [Lentimicrobiaceae bacterium]MCP4910507.1 acetyl-CoA C-acyltransferase [Bacteroidota bacterium]MBT3455361.1 acetyl-CoA C-acyltransferase [Lentimicrobiaceae bacterium]MBT3818799.1 acetyl-CoA C-acyltransferase [Lentimicrobiaceae bacterium]MBT4062066.1 acetyl-CoA C-acyltransferase [Lentimicrobiaceae bacterium]